MKNFLFPGALILLFLSVAACSTPKPPAPGAVQGDKVIASLKDLSSNYERKNSRLFLNSVSSDFKDRQELARAVEAVFAKYEYVHFTIHWTKMIILVQDKGMTKAIFNWDSDWQTAGGSMLKNSGRATFLFEPKDGRLVAIEGKNPFIPQAIEAPAIQ